MNVVFLYLCRLVVVCRHHPEPVVMALLSFLAPSRPFAVYCHLLEVGALFDKREARV